MMRLLTRSDVQRSISMREAVEAVKRAFIELSTGRADVPLRIALSQPKGAGVTLVMPGYLSDSESLAVKVVSVHDRNAERDLPRINAIVVVIDTATGRAVAAMDGGYLTALRTGAASGAATDLLARQDAEVAAVIGAGAQARAQALSLTAVRPVKRIWIYSRRREQVNEMIAEIRPQLGPSIELLAADSPSQAVREALVVCAATTSSIPVFDGAELRPGAHVNGVGSYRPEMQEVNCATLRRASKIVVEFARGRDGRSRRPDSRYRARRDSTFGHLRRDRRGRRRLETRASGRRRDHILQIGRQRSAGRRRRPGGISTGAAGRHRNRNRFVKLRAVMTRRIDNSIQSGLMVFENQTQPPCGAPASSRASMWP